MTSRPRLRFEALFAAHRTESISELWPWQREVLTSTEASDADVAVDLPTGTGKTLIGLLVGEDFRGQHDQPVAYLTGNKQLAQQVERQAQGLEFPIVRFQGDKHTWRAKDVRDFNYARAIGVMNYWNYFNASPGVEPAGLLIMDDVHLLEQPLRDMFTVVVPSASPLYREVLRRIVSQFSYYTLAQDLLNRIDSPAPPEMLAFADSVQLASEIRDLFDAQLTDGSSTWWAWQRIRSNAEACCWLVSRSGVTVTPYIPPSQTIPHFSLPRRRIYLSATVGSVDDLRRRLGARPLTSLTASAQPRQGERLVVLSESEDSLSVPHLVDSLRTFVAENGKALWLCARRDTAKNLVEALKESGLSGRVRLLEGDNGADEPFAAESTGNLVAAGRYDGMDFPDDACRVEVVPEVPVATSDLEQWTSAYLRDAGFGDARFAQRTAQALGRCNRSESDRAVYFLTDPEFVVRFSQRRILDSLPDDVRSDVFDAVERSDRGLAGGHEDARRFLAGETFSRASAPRRSASEEPVGTSDDEVSGLLALWREDYWRAAEHFDAAATQLNSRREHRAFWLALRSLALQLAGRHGDIASNEQAKAALRSAAATGASSTFFTRLRLSEQRLPGVSKPQLSNLENDTLFMAWDALVSRYGAEGPAFDRWWQRLRGDLRAGSHDAVVQGIARFGREVLGLGANTPSPTQGEHDADWELREPSRVLAFEVKLAPTRQRTVNADVNQAEGAVRALEQQRARPARGLIVTPWSVADDSAIERLDRTRLIELAVFADQVERHVRLLREYRRGWNEDSEVRRERRLAVDRRLPPRDWLWQATHQTAIWVGESDLARAWPVDS